MASDDLPVRVAVRMCTLYRIVKNHENLAFDEVFFHRQAAEAESQSRPFSSMGIEEFQAPVICVVHAEPGVNPKPGHPLLAPQSMYLFGARIVTTTEEETLRARALAKLTVDERRPLGLIP